MVQIMSHEQITSTGWRYFGRDSRGKVFEIYRCPANGKKIEKQALEEVYVLLADGTWRSNMREVLVGEMMKGWFDEDDAELSVEEVQQYYMSWKAGTWPGRN